MIDREHDEINWGLIILLSLNFSRDSYKSSGNFSKLLLSSSVIKKISYIILTLIVQFLNYKFY